MEDELRNIKNNIKLAIIRLANIIGYLHFCKTEYQIILLKLDAIGDFVLWISAAQKIIENNLNNRILLICSKANAELASRYLPEVEVKILDISKLSIAKAGFLGFLRMIFSVSNLQCKQLISPTYSRTAEMDEVAYLIKAKSKVAIDGDCSNITEEDKRRTDRYYDILIESPSITLHELDRNMLFVNKLYHTGYSPQVANLKKHNNKSGAQDKPYFIVIPGGSNSIKTWEISRMVEIVARIKRNKNLECVICGSEEEQNMVKQFETMRIEVTNKVGCTSILELIDLIEDATFLIGNDSSGVHFAVALQVPSICICMGAQYGRFQPYSRTCVEKKYMPIVAAYEMECFGCGINRYEKIQFTQRCKKNIEENEKYFCISKVDIEQVWKLVFENLLKGEL